MKVRYTVLALLAALSAACGVDMEEIRDHQRAWQRENISDYVFVYKENCFCNDREPSGVRVDVRDGQAQSNVGATSGISFPDAALTLDDLFDRALQFLERHSTPDEFAIRYHPELSFIEHFNADPEHDAEDDNYGFEVRCFARASNACAVPALTAEECLARDGEVKVVPAGSSYASCDSPYEIVAQVDPGSSMCCARK